MGKCKTCGAWGIFLKIDSDGNCEKCGREKIFRVKKEVEEQKVRAELERIPVFKILGHGLPNKPQKISDISDLKYSKITAKTDVNKLGTFVVLDTETTGLSSARDEIIEVAAIKYKAFEPTEIFQTLIKPKKDIPQEATAINGICYAMVENAPMFYMILPELQEFVNGYNIIGHNLEFDLKFLYRAGLNIEDKHRKFYCTKELAKSCLKAPKYKYDKSTGEYQQDYNSDYDVEDYKLDTLCKAFKIYRAQEHRALGDAFDTARLFKEICEYKIQ